MDKTQKADAVKGLHGLFTEAGAVVVAHYSGMTVAQMGELRSRLRKAGASFKVAKNRLAMRALEGTQAAGISDLFKGPTGIAYSKDPVAAPKVVVAYARENDKLKILGRAALARPAPGQDHRSPAGPCNENRRRVAGARGKPCPGHRGPRKEGCGVKALEILNVKPNIGN
jgi:large subunit ribosomal protein L10